MTATRPAEVYFADARGLSVLGPYLKGEIGPQLRARELLGYPGGLVWYVEAWSVEQARQKVQSLLRRSSFYVSRTRLSDGKPGWTGPIRGMAQAQREVAAWHGAGWSAEVVLSSASVRKAVRAWEKGSR
jgi:hypothetical protein